MALGYGPTAGEALCYGPTAGEALEQVLRLLRP